MKKFLGTEHLSIAVILLLASFLPAWGQEQINLSEAVEKALLNNRSLLRQALRVQSFQTTVEKAESEFDLRLQPDGAAGVDDQAAVLAAGIKASKKLTKGTQLEVSSRFLKNTSDEENEQYRGSIEVAVRQPLFRDFGTEINLEPIVKTGSQLTEIKRLVEMQKNDLIVNVVRTYTDLIQLDHLIKSDEQSITRMEKLYRLTRARERQGRTTRSDSLSVDLQRGQAEARFENHRQKYLTEMKNFAELLGQEPEATYTLEPVSFIEERIPGIKEAVDTALENRLDYAQALQNHQDSQRGTQLAQQRLKPGLALISRYERFGEGDDVSEAAGFDDQTWFIGFSVDTELFQSRERLSVKQALLDEASAAQQVEIIALAISRQVQQDLSAYRRAASEVKIAGRNFEIASSRAELARRLFEMGRGDIFTVTESESAYIEAENQLLTSRAEALVSLFHLRRTLGTLIESPEELKPGAVKFSGSRHKPALHGGK